MDPARWQRVEALVESALQRSGVEREAFLREVCRDEATLLRELEGLIGAYERVDSFMEEPAYLRYQALTSEPESANDIAIGSPALATGHRIGPYVVERLLGTGGMGQVYLAARADHEFRRQVAIKLLTGRHFGPDAVRRFRMERQILANLDHPNIARLFEGGTLDDGRPYLVMEYIQGVPLCRYCDDGQLDLVARLDLFRAICAAVHHAHQSLVLHLDIKPSNILVTDDGTPKLLDFGIAKWLRDDRLEATITHAGFRPLTPQYASPEQLRGASLTTASDVYSLGVVLYRLLSGRLPHQGHIGDFSDAVLERLDDVIKPSDIRSGMHELPYPRQHLRGDLDNIVMMALRTAPTRRYSSAAQLSEDLRRYQVKEPVLAHRDTFVYRTSRFLARHWLSVTGTTLIALALIGITVFALANARRLTRERDRAEQARMRAEQISNFMSSLFRSAAPSRARETPVTAREILDAAVQKLPEKLHDQPEVRAAIQHTMGTTYRELGHYQRAAELLRRALTAREFLLGREHTDVLDTIEALAGTYHAANLQDRALPLFERGLQLRRKLRGPRHISLVAALHNIGSVYYRQGDNQRSRELFMEAIDLAHENATDDATLQQNIVHLYKALALTEWRSGDLARAEALLERALQNVVTLRGEEHVDTALIYNDLGSIHRERGAFERARPMLQRALDTLEKARGKDHPWYARAQFHMAMLHLDTGDKERAETLLTESLATLRERVAEDHPYLQDSARELSRLRTRNSEESD